MARLGRSKPAISTIVSMRASASRGALACTVESEPSWPVFMAWSMSRASGATDLTHDDAVGPHAQAVANQIPDGDLALALQVGRAGFEPDHVVLVKLQLDRVLDGDDALVVRARSWTAR